ncbi:MAG: glycosyltransferase family protein [Candidatus Hermodarchaeota archaeon]
MKKIIYYISDHGFGHATRSIAIIDALLKNFPNIEIIVRTSKSATLVQRSLNSSRARLLSRKNDFGLISNPTTFAIDIEKTKEQLVSWIDTWPQYNEIEREFLQRVDASLVLSDIVPQPFLVAHELGIPSIGISNFDWYDVYKPLFPKNEIIEKIKFCYELGSMALILPMELPMEGFKRKQKIAMISREINDDLAAFRRQEFNYQIYYGTGFSLETPLLDTQLLFEKNICLIVPYNSPLREQNNIFKIPLDEVHSQNIIAASDLIITKPGYGTVSEAIKGRKPLALIKSNFSAETKAITQNVIEMGVGREISLEDLLTGGWINEIENLLNMRKNYENLPERYIKDGCSEIINIITEII